MEKREYKNGLASKKRISVAYLSLCKQKRKFSVCDVVNEAKVNRGTFYLHFKNLDEVKNYLAEYLSQNLKALEGDFRMTDLSKTPEAMLSKLNKIIMADLDFFKQIVCLENNPFMKQIERAISVSISNNFEVMKYITNLENFKIVVKLIVSGSLSVYTDWLKGLISCTIDELASFVAQLIRGGLKEVIRYAN